MQGRIRPATEEDLPGVVALYARVYPQRADSSLDRRAAYMRRLLWENPWRTRDLPSLVYQDDSGRISGFLGVLPRPMWMRGRPIQMAVSHHFMVDSDRRTTLAGLALLKAFLDGPQDLSISEPGPISRKIWEAVGGTTVLFQSLFWKRVIRPAGYGALLLRQRRLSPIAYALAPLCKVLDFAANRIPLQPFQIHGRDAEPGDDAPDAEALHASIESCSRECALRPAYDAKSLGWLLDVLAGRRGTGTLRKRLVRTTGQGTVGHYLYYVKPGGVSEVVQVGARKNSVGVVLDDLIHDAWRQGSVGLSGRLDPRYATAISDRRAYFKYRQNWFLIHSRVSEVQRAIEAGDAFLTRLEGEWWIPFRDGTGADAN